MDVTTRNCSPATGLRAEEIRHDAIGSGGRFARQIFRGFETYSADIIIIVRTQQRPVVAADVQHAVSRMQARKMRGASRDIRQRRAHRGADSGLVPIMGIEPFRRSGVPQLRQAAVAAKQQIQWHARPALAVRHIREIRDVQIPQVQHAFQAVAFARPASRADFHFGVLLG